MVSKQTKYDVTNEYKDLEGHNFINSYYSGKQCLFSYKQIPTKIRQKRETPYLNDIPSNNDTKQFKDKRLFLQTEDWLTMLIKYFKFIDLWIEIIPTQIHNTLGSKLGLETTLTRLTLSLKVKI